MNIDTVFFARPAATDLSNFLPWMIYCFKITFHFLFKVRTLVHYFYLVHLGRNVMLYGKNIRKYGIIFLNMLKNSQFFLRIKNHKLLKPILQFYRSLLLRNWIYRTFRHLYTCCYELCRSSTAATAQHILKNFSSPTD